MEISTINGVVFVGVLFIASLLLADRKLVRLRCARQRKVWLLNLGRHRQRSPGRTLLVVPRQTGAEAGSEAGAGKLTRTSVPWVTTSGRKEALSAASMDSLTAFGLLAVTAMLVFYALERRSPSFVFAFGVACILASA